MGEKVVVRNTSGSDISVEYGGATYRFDAGQDTPVESDLADVAQHRHAHEGLKIVTPRSPQPAYAQQFHCPNDDFVTNDRGAYERHRTEAHARSASSNESVHPVQATTPTIPVRGRAVPAPPGTVVPTRFRCPSDGFVTNDKAEYDNHLASAHGLSEQARKDAEAEALPKAKRTKKQETARRLKGAAPAEKKAIKAQVKKDDQAHKARAKKARKEKA